MAAVPWENGALIRLIHVVPSQAMHEPRGFFFGEGGAGNALFFFAPLFLLSPQRLTEQHIAYRQLINSSNKEYSIQSTSRSHCLLISEWSQVIISNKL